MQCYIPASFHIFHTPSKLCRPIILLGMLNKQLQFEDPSPVFTTKNLAEKIPHLSIVFRLIFIEIETGHYVTNPNNAPENGKFPKSTIRLYCLILSTWAHVS